MGYSHTARAFPGNWIQRGGGGREGRLTHSCSWNVLRKPETSCSKGQFALVSQSQIPETQLYFSPFLEFYFVGILFGGEGAFASSILIGGQFFTSILIGWFLCFLVFIGGYFYMFSPTLLWLISSLAGYFLIEHLGHYTRKYLTHVWQFLGAWKKLSSF